MKAKVVASLIAAGLAGHLNSALAQSVYIKELPGLVRFEQYTGSGGPLALWRLPTPGTSKFPGTNCINAIVPTADATHTARFIAMYLAQNAAGKEIFYWINPTNCNIVSFGIE